jgi:hypothetical protein
MHVLGTYSLQGYFNVYLGILVITFPLISPRYLRSPPSCVLRLAHADRGGQHPKEAKWSRFRDQPRLRRASFRTRHRQRHKGIFEQARRLLATVMT